VVDFIQNYATVADYAVIAPPADSLFLIHSINIAIECSVIAPGSGQYGNVTALTNGLAFEIADGTGLIATLTNGQPIKVNGDYARYSATVDALTFGNGNTFVKVAHVFPVPLLLDGAEGQYFRISLHDDFSGLVSHTFYVNGTSMPSNVKSKSRIHTKYLIHE